MTEYFFNKLADVQQLYEKESPAQLFSCKYGEIFKNTFLTNTFARLYLLNWNQGHHQIKTRFAAMEINWLVSLWWEHGLNILWRGFSGWLLKDKIVYFAKNNIF